MKNLIIVESPHKAKTIKHYLGKDYEVLSSYGHVLDLPKNRFGVNTSHGKFTPYYLPVAGRDDVVKKLKETAEKVKDIYLAPDPDREGEAISWHLYDILKEKNNSIKRITFNEITPKAVKNALANPKNIDKNKVDAQQTRRILDRIVGYKISPLLFNYVKKGLSAGRVQSVALRLICEREEEINNFVPEEYWSIKVELYKEENEIFSSKLMKKNNKNVKISNKKSVDKIIDDLSNGEFKVSNIIKSKRRKRSPAPFITSTMQQTASKTINFSPSKTMMIAQQLYEGIPLGAMGEIGLITYMRTDSIRVNENASKSAYAHIISKYSAGYVGKILGKRKTSKTKVQDAHEAIRPTNLANSPEKIKKYLSRDQYKLYKLIYDRFLASHMADAIYNVLTIEITNQNYLFKTVGSHLDFDGFLKLYIKEKIKDESEENGKKDKGISSNKELELNTIPDLNKNDILNLNKYDTNQYFTQPKPRYSEATLIKELESNGVGRPSTYASILSTIFKRKYVNKEKKSLQPTHLGIEVNNILIKYFSDIFNVKFTADMESKLDLIENSGDDWQKILQDFYTPFLINLKDVSNKIKEDSIERAQTGIKCDKCKDGEMIVKSSRTGRFLACSNYPKCKNTKSFRFDKDKNIVINEPIVTDIDCDSKGCNGKMVIKNRGNSSFLACSNYPKCKNIKQYIRDKDDNIKIKKPEETDEKCPKCGANLLLRTGRNGKFYACSKFPKCRFTKTYNVPAPCPVENCDGLLQKKYSRKKKTTFYICTNYEKCNYSNWDKIQEERCPKCGNPYMFYSSHKKIKYCPICDDNK